MTHETASLTGDPQCNVTSVQGLQCAHAPEPGWPVSDTRGLVLGFTEAGPSIQPLRDQMEDIGDTIASDIAVRFQAGDSRLLKCRKSEKSSVEFLLVRFVDKTDNAKIHI